MPFSASVMKNAIALLDTQRGKVNGKSLIGRNWFDVFGINISNGVKCVNKISTQSLEVILSQ